MSTEYLHAIRDVELDVAMPGFPAPRACRRVVDVGAGTGRQAARLAERGYDVVAIDLPTSAYAQQRVHEVVEYDGVVLPFESGTVHVIYSSNVLEHIDEHAKFFAECRRVLASDGVAIHVLPTTAWRLWTTVAHVPWLLKRVFQVATGQKRRASLDPRNGGISSPRSGFLSDLFPKRHGERGNTLTEAWYFSESWWRRQFDANGFDVSSCESGRLFYTGAGLFGLAIPIKVRRHLATLLGASCKVYVTRKRASHG